MPPQHVDSVALLRELQHHNDFFDSFVDMIPAKLYVAGNSGDERLNYKYFKGQHKQSKELKRAKTKAAKRAKYDPSLAETTLETKQRLKVEQTEQLQQSLTEATGTTRDETNNKQNTKEKDTVGTKSSRIEALRAKLHAKIAEKRAQRPNVDSSKISKRAARRAEKQKRQKNTSGGGRVANQTATTSLVPTTATTLSSSPMDDLKHLDFGTLSFGATDTKTNNKSLGNLHKTRSLQKMLQDAENKKKRLEELKRDSKTDQVESLLWKDTFQEANGQRIKDDPAKIKKVLKRKAAKKQQSQKAWKSRLQNVETKAKEKQAIRQHNLQQRKVAGSNLSKKRIVSPEGNDKKKRNRAGFEGRKQEFLNTPKSKNAQ